jgi:ABC-type nickel/cobalt efflux system permease component RcnA
MLSSKKSPRKSELFHSRFMAAGQDAATIRDVQRLREYLAGQVILAILQIGFIIALALFARALYNLFERHAEALNPMYFRLSMGGVLVCFLLVCRRLFLRIREIIGVRREMRHAHDKLRSLRERLRGKDDHASSRAP